MQEGLFRAAAEAAASEAESAGRSSRAGEDGSGLSGKDGAGNGNDGYDTDGNGSSDGKLDGSEGGDSGQERVCSIGEDSGTASGVKTNSSSGSGSSGSDEQYAAESGESVNSAGDLDRGDDDDDDDDEGLDFACDEFRLAQQASAALMSEHRRTWITMADLIQIKQLGWTSVRLPIGHWVLDVGGERVAEHGDGGPPIARRPAPPYEGERAWIADAAPYCGPDESAIDRCLDMCEKLSLTVNLCLHGAPGGQSGEQACGFADPLWQPSMWDVDASVRCVEHMARRWARRRSGVVDAITVINEPPTPSPRNFPAFTSARTRRCAGTAQTWASSSRAISARGATLPPQASIRPRTWPTLPSTAICTTVLATTGSARRRSTRR